MAHLRLSNVGRTAIDALQAKASAAGSEDSNIPVVNSLHSSLLGRVATALHSSTSPESLQEAGGVTRPSQVYEEQATGGEDKTWRVRRQTPLVNAGYGARMAAVSLALERYLSAMPAGAVNIVLLGCGLDVLGLWACRLYPGKVRLYEIDMPEICELKFRVLVQNGLFCPTYRDAPACPPTPPLHTQQPDDAGTTGEFQAAHGYLSLDGGGFHPPSETDNSCCYTLLAANLRDVSNVKTAFARSDMERSRPTLVLSEVVLAYLLPKEVDSLLSYIADHLCASPCSMFWAFEPLGPLRPSVATRDAASVSHSVISTYKQDYFVKFSSKLLRGKQTEREPSLFHPLGHSCASVVERLRRCGFPSQRYYVDASLAARRWWIRSQTPDPCSSPSSGRTSLDGTLSQTAELFDEHASLALFLRSYVVVCAISAGDGASATIVESVCPWVTPAKSQPKSTVVPHGEFEKERSTFRVLPIEQAHERQVRTLYQTTYSELFGQFPAVKRMVDRAMETDLKVDDDSNQPTVHASGGRRDPCAILRRYMMMGGSFWVAVALEGDERSEALPASSEDTGDGRNVVVGCVGVREIATDLSRDAYSSCSHGRRRRFEILRLSVHPAYRSQGIGRSLLEIVERYVKAPSSSTHEIGDELNEAPHVVATTPSVLEVANQSYASCGFDVMEVKTLGKMLMVTYGKLL